MINIPEGCTHVWTPGAVNPYLKRWLFRRFYYKRVNKRWYSFTIDETWAESINPPEWFKKERDDGYLVTVKKFINPLFIPKKEEL